MDEEYAFEVDYTSQAWWPTVGLRFNDGVLEQAWTNGSPDVDWRPVPEISEDRGNG